ncbi:histidinol phosphatase [Dokdonia sinensis]|uniref:protein-tyrosine-phosphatase n=1 Tax=Dokdonia sinensis TaxID=2479847 RepID=A0A3M0H2E9_9FLAO|nr:CpsB/CapC family capsule biosynthesis tyrosine phosphatase [Dokdonia sinensis]RMB63826.1 histidinol phosphatase [Dokdonia sinensis]
MLSIFSKKTFLLDIIAGIPDIHCHVLPGIDDGAKDVQSSTDLLHKYRDLGFKKIIATPHTLGEIYTNTRASIAKAYTEVKGLVPEVSLSYASEYMLDYEFEQLLESDSLLCLKDNYLLVELSYFQPPIHLMELIFSITSKGYIPVIAHPERYAYYHKDLSIFEIFKGKGCHLQLNALSLSSHYGSHVQRQAFKLLASGAYDFIGTDTHRLEHLEKIAEIKISSKYLATLRNVALNNDRVFS